MGCRYTAHAQRALSLHVDGSEMSFQVALNSELDGDFSGGGLYLQAMDCAVPLETGELLTFAGQLLHGVRVQLIGHARNNM